jgi:hypothetical protein
MWGRKKNKRKHKKKVENIKGESNKEITKRNKNKRKICKLLKLLLLTYAAYKVSNRKVWVFIHGLRIIF